MTDKVHSYPKQRTIRDAPVRGCVTFLIFDSVRLECHVCHNVFTLEVRDVVPDCTYTYRLAELIADPSRKQDCATLARTFDLGYKLVESILLKAAEDKLNDRKEEPIQVKLLGIDEISNTSEAPLREKGHGGYVLILTDLERRVLLDILPDRQKDTLKEWLESPVDGVKLDDLSQVAIDLWAQYRDAVGEVFEDVLVVADRFHVVQNLNKAIDKERRQAQSEAIDSEEKSKLKGLRFLLKKKKDKLTDSEKKRLEQLKETHPKLYQLWLMREKLYKWYQTDTTPEVAKESLSEWIKEAK
ncbi:MAG: ISL3 family transposase [Ardenticatenaceae bacterium]